jgi:hypothetical protein
MPRNNALYCALRRLYEDVAIANEGEEAEVTVPVVMSVQRRLGRVPRPEVSGGEQYRVDCPFCGDRNKHLYVSHLWGATVELEGKSYEIGTGLARCFRRECLKEEVHRVHFAKELRAALKDSPVCPVDVSVGEEDYALPGVPLPDGCVPVGAGVHTRVEDWLAGRAFGVPLLRQFGVHTGICHYGQLPLECAVFPVWMDGTVVGWQARPIDYAKGAAYPKYFNSKGFKKSWVLYNMDNAAKQDGVVVVEGITDVLRVGLCGVALFGKAASKHQEALLRRLWHGKLIVLIPDMNDPESKPEFEGLRRRLAEGRAFKSIKMVTLPDGMDPGGMPKEELWNNIKDQTLR